MELPLHHTDWLLGVLLLSFIMIIAAKLYNGRRLKDFAMLPFHSRRRDLEENFNPVPGKGFVDFSLSLNSTLIITVSCFLLLHPYQGKFPLLQDWTAFLMLFFALMIFFLFKNFMAGYFTFSGLCYCSLLSSGLSGNVFYTAICSRSGVFNGLSVFRNKNLEYRGFAIL